MARYKSYGLACVVAQRNATKHRKLFVVFTDTSGGWNVEAYRADLQCHNEPGVLKFRSSDDEPNVIDSLRELLDLIAHHCQGGNPPCARTKAAMERAYTALREAGHPVDIERIKP